MFINMNKKVNIFNVVVSVFVLGVYVYCLLSKGREFLLTYNINMLYFGAGIGIVLLLFSLFKLIRNSIWMDIIYMIYLLMFIGFNIYGLVLGKNWNLYAIYYCYPIWTKYLLISVLVLNIVYFVLSFREENKDE